MSRYKKLNQAEYRTMLCNMVDLGFTVPAICYMTNRTSPAVYALLKRMNKMKGRRLLRSAPAGVHNEARKRMGRVFDNPDLVADALKVIHFNGHG